VGCASGRFVFPVMGRNLRKVEKGVDGANGPLLKIQCSVFTDGEIYEK